MAGGAVITAAFLVTAFLVAALLSAAATACAVSALLPWCVADEAGMRLLRPGGRRRRLEGMLIGVGIVLAALPAALPLLAFPAGAPAPSSGTTVLPAVCVGLAVGAAAGATPFLVWIDLRIRRLPDRIVLPLIGLTSLSLLGAGAAGASAPFPGGHGPIGALVIGAASGLLVLLVSVIGGRGQGLAIGLGDVKLAVVLGALTALVGSGALLAAYIVAQVSALCEALVRVAVLRQGMATRIAYGPHLLLGMWTGPLLHAVLR